jgi:signal transduction histidine kinase
MGGVPQARPELSRVAGGPRRTGSRRTERDRAERDRLERDRPEGDRAEQDLDERRAQFLAVVSHELRTPLTSIVSFSELLRGEARGLSADGARFLDIIERNADRLLRLIDDLLMLDRLEAGALPLERTAVDVPGLAAEAARSAAAVAAKSGVVVHLDASEGPPLTADARRLGQVLDNLIGNAVKFSNVGGLVRVTVRYARGSWRITVSDTGIGIPPDEAAKLFGAFVRGSNARTAGLPGTGLGLSIVKALVEMHGGQVKVDSVLNQGTTFTVLLPVAVPPVRL